MFKHKVVRYTNAVTRWILAGKPTRTDEEVEKLLATCKQCEEYDEEKQRCKACGCNINLNTNPLLNKLRMGTEQCPKGKWG